jgi:hypothetical protein
MRTENTMQENLVISCKTLEKNQGIMVTQIGENTSICRKLTTIVKKQDEQIESLIAMIQVLCEKQAKLETKTEMNEKHAKYNLEVINRIGMKQIKIKNIVNTLKTCDHTTKSSHSSYQSVSNIGDCGDFFMVSK